jgi:hypothetical protein
MTHSQNNSTSIPASPAKPREDHIILIEKPKQFSQTFSGFMFATTSKAPESSQMASFSLFQKSRNETQSQTNQNHPSSLSPLGTFRTLKEKRGTELVSTDIHS